MEKLRISCVPVGNAIQFPVIMHVCVWVHALHTATIEKKKKTTKNQKHFSYNHGKLRFLQQTVETVSCLLLIRYRHEVAVVNT